jgi:CBS domain-containing protein
MRRTVEKVMTRTVAVVGPRSPFKAIVEVMADNRVSAVPVMDDDGALVGIVTEEDLLLKEGRFQDHVSPLAGPRRRREGHKAEGLFAGELMTSPVITVSPNATLAEAARRMHERGVKRLPVIDAEGRLVGIVSRADLLRVFVRPDPFLEKEVHEDVIARHFPEASGALSATVHEGVLHLTGTMERGSQLDLLLALLAGVDGLVGIENEVSVRIDDRKPSPYAWGAAGSFGYAFVPWGVLAAPKDKAPTSGGAE